MKKQTRILCMIFAAVLSITMLSSCNKNHFKDYQNNNNNEEYGADFNQSSIFDDMEFNTNYTDPNANNGAGSTDTDNPFDNEEVKDDISKFYYNVKQMGAVGDGETDDTVAFEKALHVLKNTGGVLYVPNGIYRITRGLVIPLGVTVQGESPSLSDKWSAPAILTSAKATQSASADFLASSNFAGSWILVDHGKGDVNSAATLRIQGNTTIHSLGFVYKEQAPVVDAVNAYPPAISFHSTQEYSYARDGVVIENICLANPYIGIFIGVGADINEYYIGGKVPHSLGRLRVHDIKGTALWKGIFIKGVLDTVDLDNINLGYTNFVPTYLKYRHTKCTDIEVARADGNNMANIKLYGANIGIACSLAYEGSASIRGVNIESYAGIGMQTSTGQYEISDSTFQSINYSNYRTGNFIGLNIVQDMGSVHRPHYLFDNVTISNKTVSTSNPALKMTLGKNGNVVLANSVIEAKETAVSLISNDSTYTSASIYNTKVTGTALASLSSSVEAGSLQFNKCTIDNKLLNGLSSKVWINK